MIIPVTPISIIQTIVLTNATTLKTVNFIAISLKPPVLLLDFFFNFNLDLDLDVLMEELDRTAEGLGEGDRTCLLRVEELVGDLGLFGGGDPEVATFNSILAERIFGVVFFEVVPIHVFVAC